MNQKEQMSLNKLVTIFGTEIPFVRLVSILSLIGVGLFFVGWIYRWVYFAFFNLEINTINLSPQSFLFLPIQVFFADSSRTFLTIVSLILTGIGIYLLVWLYDVFTTQLTKFVKFLDQRFPATNSTTPSPRGGKFPTSLKHSWQLLKSLAKKLFRSLLSFGGKRKESLTILQGLIEEIISVSLVILVFYWLARTQGLADARRDAGPNSTQPVISFIAKDTQLPLGGKLDNILGAASVKGFTIIGDQGMFESIQNNDDTNITNPNNPMVLRLLLEQNGWFYLFYELPPNAPPEQRPLVLALKENQMLILSPEPTRQKTN